MKSVYEIVFPLLVDSRGNLTPIEFKEEIPFDVKRMYYVYDVPESAERGYHAHYETQQVFLCVRGSVTIVFDDGREVLEKVLDKEHIGVYCGKMIWHYMKDFSHGAVFVALASQEYIESDYVRSYSEFLKEVK